jgi:hypothetical protein
MMGSAATLITGGNDSLLLSAAPSLATHAPPALFTMLAVQVALLSIAKRWKDRVARASWSARVKDDNPAPTAGRTRERASSRVEKWHVRLVDHAVVDFMTPRTVVDWIEINSSEAVIRERLISKPHSRLPVGEGWPDALIGVVQTREHLAGILAGKPLDILTYARNAPAATQHRGSSATSSKWPKVRANAQSEKRACQHRRVIAAGRQP